MTARRVQKCIGPACGRELPLDARDLRCPACGEMLDVVLEPAAVAADARAEAAARRGGSGLDASGVWRFRELLPFGEEDLEGIVSLAEGDCPQLESPGGARYAGLDRLWVKHLGFNPTGSFKDYGMTVAVTQAKRLGCTTIACASTGNTSASLAAYAARGGLQGAVLVPAGQVARGKMAQTIDYGATTLEVDGSFDDALAALLELSHDEALYLANSVNPFRLEGQKIVMAELAEAWAWRLPPHIIVAGGNLGNAAAFGKGLRELQQLGWIGALPQLHIVQAAGAAPLARTLESGSESLVEVDHPATLATAIRIGRPVSWKKALRALDWTGGTCLSVGEAGIADARAALARDGIGCEPASAAALEGARRLVETGRIRPDEKVVAILTGHQLKDPDYILDYHSGELRWDERPLEGRFSNPPRRVSARPEAIREALGL